MKSRKRKKARARFAPVIFVLALTAAVFTLAMAYAPANGQNEPPSVIVTPDPSPARDAQAFSQATAPDIPAEPVNTLILVNKNNKLPDGYAVDLVSIDNERVAKVLRDDLNDMLSAAKNERIVLNIRSAYRTRGDQAEAFDGAVAGYVNQGNSHGAAVERAELVAARPGYSEHQTGLAIDFSYGADAEIQTAMWEWLNANAYKYGFILRYPEGRERDTGYSYEPWHYRYVGREHARIIYGEGLILEEYLNIIN